MPTFMLVMKTGPIGYIAAVATNGALEPGEFARLRVSIPAHAVGLLVLRRSSRHLQGGRN